MPPEEESFKMAERFVQEIATVSKTAELEQ